MRMLLLTGLLALGAVTLPGASDRFRDCSECPVMVRLPAGSFEMGATSSEIEREGLSGTKAATSGVPRRSVSVKSFSLSATEVTRDDFELFVRATGYKITGPCWVADARGFIQESEANNMRSPGFVQNGRHPVVCVSWKDAAAYTKWLSQKTGKHYRLPSEAEWEYAARGGTTTTRYWGDAVDDALCDNANVADETARKVMGYKLPRFVPCADGFVHTSPVGSFRANPFGLLDMLGNVWEWTEDCYNRSYENAPTDGSAQYAGDCSQRVTRGGSWEDAARSIRAAARANDGQDDRAYMIGFRVARTD